LDIENTIPLKQHVVTLLRWWMQSWKRAGSWALCFWI